jgi:MoxR-like ATPase
MVERFDLVQYEHFDQLDRAVNGDWVRYSDHEAELSALKKQVEELTAERDAQPQMRRLRRERLPAVQLPVAEAAEAEAAALREALDREQRTAVDWTPLPDMIDAAPAIVRSRQVADRHQHSDAALTSTKETSE